MYCSHFGLERFPFNNTPDPTFYYSTPDHEEALATLQYAATQRKGFVLVTGEVGAGKTLIGRMFLRRIDDVATTAVVTHTNLGAHQLLSAICGELSLDAPAGATNLDLTRRLQDFLLQEFARDRIVVVLIDEAQNLPDESLEELRMLGNLEADDAKLLQVCILGQPELRGRFARPNMKQLDQRLFSRFHLPALSLDQTGAYIARRLEVAGYAGEGLFAAEAVARIHAASQGIPRLINHLCDNALLTAYGQESRIVDENVVDLVVGTEGPREHGTEGMRDGGTEGQESDTFGREDDEMRIPPSLCPAVPPSVPIASDAPDRSEETASRELKRLAARQDQLQQMLANAASRWTAARDGIDSHRRQVQLMVEELVGQCRATRDQLEEVSRRSTPPEAIDQLRGDHNRQISQVLDEIGRQQSALKRMAEGAEAQWSAIDRKVRELPEEPASREALAALEREQDRRIHETLTQVDRQRGRIEKLVDSLREQCERTQENVSELQSTRVTEDVVARLQERVEAHDNDIRTLSGEAVEQFRAAQEMLKAVRDASSGTEEIERIREQQEAAIDAVMRRVEAESQALAAFRTEIREQAQRYGAEDGRALEALSARVEEQATQVGRLRRNMIKSHRKLLEKLEQVGRRFAEEHEAQKSRVDGLGRRVQEQGAEVSRISERLGMLDEIERDRRRMRELIDGIAERLGEAQKELQGLNDSAAEAGEVDEIRRRQASDVETIQATLAGQRRELEVLVREVDARCDQLLARIDALPADVATAEQIESLREDHAAQFRAIQEDVLARRADFEWATADLNERCSRTHAAVEALAQRAASVDDLNALARRTASVEELHALAARSASAEDLKTLAANTASIDDLQELAKQSASVEDIETLRERQDRSAADLLTRIEQESSEHDRDVADLNARWEALTESIRTLAESTTPAARFEAVERSMSTGLTELTEHVRGVADQQGRHLRTVVEKLQDNAERVTALERMSRPRPVQMELTPQASIDLARLLRSAEQQRQSLSAAMERGDESLTQLETRTGRVEALFEQWASRTNAVEAQSEKLRASAEKATEILQAMQRCHEVIDARLNSKRWQLEMGRAEDVATRLEGAASAGRSVCDRLQGLLDDAQEARGEVDAWSNVLAAARETTQRLSKLIAEAGSADTRVRETLDRQQLLKLIARNAASLAEVVRSARAADERTQPTDRPANGRGHDAPQRVVKPVHWPKLRAHQAQVS